MRIWLITIGEPLPIDGTNERLLRTGILAKLLVAEGHEIVWWSSTFNHLNKKHRFGTDTSISLNERFRFKLLHSIAYKKNVSVNRIVNHFGIARKFSRLADSEPQPDIILCSLPTLELSLAATKYGKKRSIPVVLDVRDLWPDIFLNLVPKWAQLFLKVLLSPMFKTVRAACAGATAIVGLTPAFVDWGVNYAKRIPSSMDRDFPMGYSEVPPNKDDIIKAEKFWVKHGVNKNNNEFIVCFFGTMGRQFEIETVIKAARRLDINKRFFRFILCGSGDNFSHYKQLSEGCKNVVFPGWVGAADIWTLMRMSSVGLAPYLNIENFTLNLPNKPIEYLSAGLPIVSSLNGVLKDILSSYNCGVSYESGNVDSLISILNKLYDHRDQLSVMSKNALNLYKEQFIAEIVYNNMIVYLESVCSNYQQ